MGTLGFALKSPAALETYSFKRGMHDAAGVADPRKWDHRVKRGTRWAGKLR